MRGASDATQVKSLVELCSYLLNRSDEILLHLEALRHLLVERRLISEDEFHRLFSAMTAEYESQVQRAIRAADDETSSERLRELLRSFDGPPQ